MGLLERHAAKKAERIAENERAAAAARFQTWQQEEQALSELLDEARSNQGSRSIALALKKDERAFQVLNGSALIEPRRLPGQWQGRSKGFSVHVAKGMNYRVGANRGHYVQGAEVPTPIDTGTVTITDRRVVFQGTKASREWAFAKLLGVQHVDYPKPWTAIQVSNRQKTSGFLYTAQVSHTVRFHLDLALAHFNEEVPDFIAGVEAQLAAHQSARPAFA